MSKHRRSVTIVAHPLISHLLTEARDARTPTERFREVVQVIGGLLAYEATRDLAVEAKPIATPLEKYQGNRLRGPVTIVPILRAGLGMAEGMTRLLPEAQTGHVGLFRDEQNLNPVHYYQKLPRNVAAGPVLLVDPMLATGGSVVAALQLLRDRNCRDIRIVCILASPEGIERVGAEFADVPIFAAAIDRQLDDRGYILPGLGDAGDRLFGTSE